MTTSPVNSADVYTDFSGLAALKKSANTNDPDAIRQVARQYESLFVRMMIKSMRDAVGKDPIFGSDEEQTYQGMYDDQLSMEMTKGRGLGLADMLVRQLQHLSGGNKTDATQSAAHGAANSAAAAASSAAAARGLRTFKDSSRGGRTATAVASPEAQANFISDLWPSAQQAGRQLGVDPRNLIAQAALETNWGTQVPRDARGRSSNNLFGVKAGSQWAGATVAAGTREYENGSAVSSVGQFRAYDSRAQSFQDYVALLQSNPRYSAALNTGTNTHAFASALQRAGYATDPDYAGKITALAGVIGSRATNPDQSLKSASALPLNPNTGML
jgi:peptidoglycan hydrolase FlgJ